jgi:hypothetical protein
MLAGATAQAQPELEPILMLVGADAVTSTKSNATLWPLAISENPRWVLDPFSNTPVQLQPAPPVDSAPVLAAVCTGSPCPTSSEALVTETALHVVSAPSDRFASRRCCSQCTLTM